MDADGRLVPEGDQLVIEVNETHSLGKQRFSTAHEIAHTLLPGYQRQAVKRCQDGGVCARERRGSLCDIGAATLRIATRLGQRVVPQ